MVEITGGDKLKAALQQIAENLGQGVTTVKSGLLAGATYPNGTPLALVGFWNEYGTRYSPARPFMRPTVDKNQAGWPGIIEANLLATNYDAKITMARLGKVIEGQIKDQIRSVTSPPLKAATIKKKGFDTPLQHSGDMLNGVTYKVD